MANETITMTSVDAAAMMAEWTDRARSSLAPMIKSSHDARQNALRKAAQLIRDNAATILAENSRDLANAEARNMAEAMVGRLMLNPARIDAMAAGLEDIADLPDPLGRELDRWQRPNGLDIARVSTPLGVIGVIYESRPNVTVDAAGLAIKSGNPVILRGGSDSFYTSSCLARLVQDGLKGAGLPVHAVQLLNNTDRALVGAMLTAVGGIDVIIPRGGRSLVERVQHEARVPVFAHLEGICHLYIDAGADPEKAVAIAVNAKMRRGEICGAPATPLGGRAVADTLLPVIGDALTTAGCSLRADAEARAILPDAAMATEADWTTEYLAPILSVAVVDGVGGAIDHINRYSSSHTESIVTENTDTAQRFLDEVDSAIVMVNTSTQFADGGEFGMGAEIGIATGRLHARGPVGAAQLTSFKYMVRGNGQTRA